MDKTTEKIFSKSDMINMCKEKNENIQTISTIRVPDGYTKIADEIIYFKYFSPGRNDVDLFPWELTRVELPESVTEIGGFSFSCNTLTHINFPLGLNHIGFGAFQCANIEKIDLSEHTGLKKIPESFAAHSALTEVRLPKSVTQIDDGAFYDCSYLTTVFLHVGVTSIDEDVFSECHDELCIHIQL